MKEAAPGSAERVPASRPAATLSIIVPVLNEAGTVEGALTRLHHIRTRGHEVIVVDGGSSDGTRGRARPHADRVLASARGRGAQMNAGAARARGDVLLFLHADTRLPEDADRLVLGGLARSGRGWGRFDLRLSGSHPLFRIGERWISWRSRLTGVATGDQGIFVRRDLFERVGGYPDIPLMEDVALSKSLRRLEPPLSLSARVATSTRRWEAHGILRTALLMCRLRFAYWRGAEPMRLADMYRGR